MAGRSLKLRRENEALRHETSSNIKTLQIRLFRRRNLIPTLRRGQNISDHSLSQENLHAVGRKASTSNLCLTIPGASCWHHAMKINLHRKRRPSTMTLEALPTPDSKSKSN
jgi:hypothetical protein